GDTDSDSARHDDRSPITNVCPVLQHVQVAQNHRVIDPGQLGDARGDASGDHHCVIAAQLISCSGGAEADIDSGRHQLVPVVAQGLFEFLLAGNLPGDVELAADAVGGVEIGRAHV